MRDNEKMGLIISRIIIFTLLLMSINAFFTQDLMIAKILSAFGFTGLLFLLLISFMAKTSA